jgi:hypothetical protein
VSFYLGTVLRSVYFHSQFGIFLSVSQLPSGEAIQNEEKLENIGKSILIPIPSNQGVCFPYFLKFPLRAKHIAEFSIK